MDNVHFQRKKIRSKATLQSGTIDFTCILPPLISPLSCLFPCNLLNCGLTGRLRFVCVCCTYLLPMKISLSWLRRFIALPESPEQLSHLLTQCGLEVESLEEVQQVPGGLNGLVIGEVITCLPHPDSEHLHLTTVHAGSPELLHIVCGASNVAAGQKVVVATVGATLYPTGGGEPLKIKKSKIRGALSEGMLCAEDEIGIGTGHDGIMVLDTTLPAGTPAAVYFNLESDTVFEIGLTPNRADAASHYGVARDLKALLNRPVKVPEAKLPISNSIGSGNGVQIVVEDSEACPRYAGLCLEGITVAPSPEWLQRSLRSIGVGPINNIVDVTNYVLHSIGQPMHAFDRAKIAGDKIIVKHLPEGTPFTTLDKTERSLKAHNLMVCNDEGPMAIAGVFGGLESGISSQTTSVFLESAFFSPASVRKTSQSLGIKTDSSFRFERGTDPNMPLTALIWAAQLITETAGGRVSSGITDVYPNPVQPAVVQVSYNYLNRLLGKELEQETINTILRNLDIAVQPEETFGHEGFAETFIATVPPYRVDVTRPADVAEEVMRIYGFNNIETGGILGSAFLAEFPSVDAEAIRYKTGDMLAAQGYSEIINNSLTNPRYAALSQTLNPDENVLILNRLSEDLGAMRQTLLFGGLQTLLHNINRKQQNLRLFEFGKNYRKITGTEGRKYNEENRLCLFVTGNSAAESWQQPGTDSDYFGLKTTAEHLLQKLGFGGLTAQATHSDLFEFGQEFILNKRPVATLGLVSSRITKAFDIKQPVFFADFDWDYLLKKYNAGLKYAEISRYPEVRRDLSLVLDKHIAFADIEALARKTEKKLLRELNVFDVFEGKQLGEGKKSYSISFTLQDDATTLTDQITDRSMARLIEVFEKELGAFVRR